MKAVIQRVSSASVEIDHQIHARIGQGLVVLLGIEKGDSISQAESLTRKITALRIFPDKADRMNLDINQVSGEILLVSQFTLCADLTKGNRPSFDNALEPDKAERLYNDFNAALSRLVNKPIKTGVFGARMQVSIQNDGPVTFVF